MELLQLKCYPVGDILRRISDQEIAAIVSPKHQSIDKVRREEQSHNVLLKKTRYVWLKNPENLTIKQNETFGSLKDLRLKTMMVFFISKGHNLEI